MAILLARVVLIAAVAALPAAALAQGAPNLSKDQRQTLLTLVNAVNASADQPATGEGWQVHLLRASDGSHYVAFSADAPGELTEDTPLALYVRLAVRATAPPSVITQRSAVEEWLLGQRKDPLPMQARRVVQIPSGEMPVGGPLSMSGRDATGQSSAALALVERERSREKAAAAARDQERRDELEGRTRNLQDLLPFEDFDMSAKVVARPGRTPVIRRALTSGPGAYDLTIGWAALDGKNRPVKTGVLKHAITLPAAQVAGLALGSIIVAEGIQVRDSIYRADQQTAHPYAIGNTEIEPAADQLFTNDEKLAVAFQVINATPSPTGKPDVSIGFRLFRVTDKGEEPAGSLTPQEYTEATLPADFDLNLGHPILAAMAAPLRTLGRGEYRLAIAATDRIARSSAIAETRFRVIATPAALLASAPPYVAAFRRAHFVEAAVLDRTLDAIAPSATTPALSRLLTLARERRFADLLPEANLSPSERGTGILLQAIGYFALGDNATAVTLQLRRALEAGAPAGAAEFWLGACSAIDRRDQDALAAWQAAAKGGWPAALLALPVAEAEVRLGRWEQAGAGARAALAAGVADPELQLIAAAADIASGQLARAIETLTPVLAANPDEGEAQWLMLHALFAGAVKQEGPGATREGRAQLIEMATRYIDGGGRHRALVEEWRAFVTSSSSAP